MSNNLAALRIKHRLSQAQLAEAVGVAALTLGRWERGEALPRPYNLKALCVTLQCTEEDLAFPSPMQAPLTLLSPVVPLYDSVIPHIPNELIGRADDLARIKAQLLAHGDGRVRLCALNGLPGVGKTSLAIAIAHDPEIRTSFSGGILWAALGPTPNIPGVLSRWAGLLGLSEALFSKLDEDQKRQTLRSALGTRTMLLVLDDVWRVDDALALRIGGPDCASLLTTRFPGIASQMAVSDALKISELNAEQSFHVLRMLAPKVTESAPEHVRALVQAVGGLPLALTLLGHYLHKHSYNVPPRRTVLALEHLDNAQARLQVSTPHIQAEAHPSIASSTPISLQSIIAVSDYFLTPLARKTLYALSIFPSKPGSFSEEAALMITASTTDALDELVDVGLLEIYGDRYRLHRIIADYARLQLDAESEAQLTQQLIAYMHQYVEHHSGEAELLEQETALLLYALDRATTGEAFEVWLVPLICVSAPFLLMRGYYQEIERGLRRAYEQARASHHSTDRTSVLLSLGELLEALSSNDMACSYEQMEQYYQAQSSDEQALKLIQDKRMALYEESLRAWYTRFLQPVTPVFGRDS